MATVRLNNALHRTFPTATLLFTLSISPTIHARDFIIPIEQHTLKNGLTVVFSEDHAAPTVAVTVCYKVGSGDERPGRTGFAHLFEHMMFGAAGNSPNTAGLSLDREGIRSSAFTTQDRTFYHNVALASQLELALYFEADRMSSLTWTKEKVDLMRASVKEERLMRVDNQPYGKSFETIPDAAYDAFPYKHIVLGSMSDLDAATLQEFQAFYRQYYAPNNATVIIVGDFRSVDALAEVKKYFEHIPAQPAPPRPDFGEAAQTSERRRIVEDSFAAAPRIDLAYKIPPGDSPDWYAIAVLTRILGLGDSSRLYQRMVRNSDLASYASAQRDKTRGPGLATITITPRPGKDLRSIENAVDEEVAKLQHQPVEDWELEKVRMSVRRWQVANAEAYLERAASLAEAVVFGDANDVNRWAGQAARLTKADVTRVARKYFTKSNRTVVITLPKGK
jgi:predicted Zn-dependent peptidase